MVTNPTKRSKLLEIESHRSKHIGWLRASVLGANDGIVSTASLIVGVAAADSSYGNILISGIAGLVGGAMSMASGEYVSVSSQSDTEKADLNREKNELATNFDFETNELTQIYEERGLDSNLAKKVAVQLMAHDSLGSHSRDELGILESLNARPIQAALASAGAFSIGALLPLSMVLLSPTNNLVAMVSSVSILSLAVLGALAALVGGASAIRGAWRVGFWGAFAMAVTAGIGHFVGTVV